MICSGPISFASHNKFRCQMNSEHERWRCMHCDRSFKSQSSLHFHKNIHKGLKPFTCKICGKAFSHPWSKKRHYALHNADRESVSCKPCGKVFIDKNSLKVHMRKFHKGQPSLGCHSTGNRAKPGGVNCRTCGKLFRSEINLRKHEALHKTSTGGRKCPHCALCFTSAVSLSNHIRMHQTQTTVNACAICKLRFNYSGNLARHMREKHPGVKVIKCGICSKVCADKRLLTLHMAIRHPAKRGVLSKHHARQQGKVKKILQPSKKAISLVDSVKYKKCKLTVPSKTLRDHMRIHQTTNTNANGVDKQVVGIKKPVNSLEEKRQNNHSKDSFERIVCLGNQRGFRCEFCPKMFPTLHLMHHHRACHFRKSTTKPANKKLMNSSFLSHSKDSFAANQDGFRCEFCQKVFPTSQLMHCHRASHFKKQSMTASPSAPSTSRENEALTKHNSKKLRCNICDKEFSSYTKLCGHKGVHFRKWRPCRTRNHFITSMRPVNLDKCRKNFPNADSRSPVWSSVKRTGRFRCQVCNKSFLTERSLRSHKTHHSRARLSNVSSPNPLLENPQESLAQSQADGKGDFKSKISSHLDRNNHATTDKKILGSSKHKNIILSSGFFQEEKRHSEKVSTKSSGELSNQNINECKLYVCGECGKKFHSKTTLNSHKGHHKRPNSFKRFKFSTNPCSDFSNQRLSSTHERKLYLCGKCGKTFQSKMNLSRHKGHHTRASSFKRFHIHRVAKAKVESKVSLDGNVSKPYECGTCLESFLSRSALGNHERRSHTGVNADFVCPFCDRTFSSKEMLFVHKQRLHSVGDPFTCLQCNRQFSSKYSRNNHVCRVEGRSEWPVESEEDVKSNPDVKESIEEHHGCNVCLESFPSKRALRNHKRSHAGRRAPFICSICKQELSSKYGLLRHKKSQHGTTQSTHLQCNDQVESKGNQSNHSLNDSGVSSVQENSSSLTSTAHGISQFTCVSCNKQFMTSSGLYKHERKYHGKSKRDSARSVQSIISLHKQFTCKLETENSNTPLRCQHCEKQFKTEFFLTMHVKKRHGKRISLVRQLSEAKSNSRHWNEFRTIHGVKKYGLRKHPGSQTVCGDQGCKPEVKSQTRIGLISPVTSSKTCIVRTFRCQYCHKGFSTINGRYKHILLVHRSELISPSSAPHASSKNQSASAHEDIMATDSLVEQDSRQTGQNGIFSDGNLDREPKSNAVNHSIKRRPHTGRTGPFVCSICQKRLSSKRSLLRHKESQHGTTQSTHLQCNGQVESKGDQSNHAPNESSENQSASVREEIMDTDILAEPGSRQNGIFSDDDLRLRETNYNTANHSIKRKTKGTALGCRVSCRYCRRRFFSTDGRRRHELKLHEKRRVGSSSALAKHKGRKIERANPFDKATSSCGKELSASENCEEKPLARSSFYRDDAKTAPGLNLQPTVKAFSCQHCPRQFFSVSARYKHILLVHSGEVRVCQVGSESSITKSPPSSYDNHGNASSVPPGEGKWPSPSSCGQPLNKRSKPQELAPVDGLIIEGASNSVHHKAVPPTSRQTSTRTKAFKCRFCSKSFSTCSLRYKHFLLVHSRSCALAEQGFVTLENGLANKYKLVHHAPSNDSVSIGHDLNESFGSQNKVVENLFSVPDSRSRVVSIFEEDLEPYNCRFCSAFFRSRSDLVSHVKEKHHNGSKGMCKMCSPSRPALRTISDPSQSNSLKTLRNRHSTRSKLTLGKEMSLYGKKVVQSELSVRPTKKSNIRDKGFQCDICLLVLSDKSKVERHKRTKHCDEKPFRCTACGFATKREDYLNIHKRGHCKG